MKCSQQACEANATIQIVSASDGSITSDRLFCNEHAHSQLPFCEEGAGVTALGSGLSGALNRFDMRYVIFFWERGSYGLYLREKSGSKRFSLPVCIYEA